MRKDAWPALDDGTRFRIALEVARRRGPSLCSASANIISVGAGFRFRGPERQLLPEVCLRFMVRRKWAGRRQHASRIPAFIRAYPLLDGRRRLVLIPTDVSEFRFGQPHGSLDLTGGITSRQGGVGLEHGSACCVVSDAEMASRRFLLSCYHVFSPRLQHPRPSGLDCIASDTGSFIGDVWDAARADTPGGLDAALVLIDDAGLDRLPVWGREPLSKATDFDLSCLHERGPLFLQGRRVAPATSTLPAEPRDDALTVQFAGLFPQPLPFDYRATAGRVFHFSDTIQYVGAVRPGDSGAALLDGPGMLYGMHFYGDGQLGYALSAPRLFDPGVFEHDILLA